MPAADSCITCHHTFPPTHELASIPDAARVAFDPGRRRVWRICAHCGEWNLLGPDAAAAALPELEARFSALTFAGESPEQFAPVHAGRVELLRIGAEGDADGSLALRLQEELQRRQLQFQRAIWVVAIGVVAIVAGELLILGKHAPNWVALLSTYLFIQPLMLLDRRLGGRRVSMLSWLGAFALAAIAAGAVGHELGWRHLGFDAVAIVVVAPFILLTGALSRKRLTLAHVVADGGRLVGLAQADIAELTLGWSDAGELQIHDLPGGRTASGKQAADLFHRVYAWHTSHAPHKVLDLATTMQTRAAELLRAVGGMRGLIRALDGYRRDRDGRIPLAQIPAIYLVAIDLGTRVEVEANAADDRAGAVRDRYREASQIADHAERLVEGGGEGEGGE